MIEAMFWSRWIKRKIYALGPVNAGMIFKIGDLVQKTLSN